MFVVESYALAVFFCVVTAICWGSYANTLKLAGKTWRFELFYWDYVFGVTLMAIVPAFTLGSTGGPGRAFLEDARQASPGNIGLAFLGGAVFNAGNILLIAAISIMGMAVAFPVAVGIALIEGVVIIYLYDPKGDPRALFLGVALVMAAIVLDALAYRRIPGQRQGGGGKGLFVSVASGVLLGLYYFCIAASMPKADQLTAVGKLGPYAAVVFFSLGILASNFVFNTLLMHKPFVGVPLSVGDYLRGTWRDHMWGVVGGLIWQVGTTFNIVAAKKASFAVSYGLGQGATMIAALWGVFVWREFKKAAPGTNRLLALMFVAYLSGLALIILANPS